LPDGALVLRTVRLTLHELQLSDLDYIAALLGDPQVMEFWGRVYTREQSLEWIQRQQARYARDGYAYWLVRERSSGRAVGQAGALRQRVGDRDEAGLAYILDKEHWGKGFATEAAAASLDYIRDVVKRPRAVCLVRPENVRSVSVAEKLAMSETARIQYYGFEHIVFAKAFTQPEHAL